MRGSSAKALPRTRPAAAASRTVSGEICEAIRCASMTLAFSPAAWYFDRRWPSCARKTSADARGALQCHVCRGASYGPLGCTGNLQKMASPAPVDLGGRLGTDPEAGALGSSYMGH